MSPSRLFLLLAFLVPFHASAANWVRLYEPALIESISGVDFPCGKYLGGCWNSETRTIEFARWMTMNQIACVLTHEYWHSLGWVHDETPVFHASPNQGYQLDCGPGQSLSR